MDVVVPREVATELVGSAQVFTRAVEELLEHEVRDASGTPLTWSQLRLLQIVATSDARNVSELADVLGISTAAASRAVARLVRRDVVRRTEDPGDRRSLRLSLTPHGTEILRTLDRARHRVLGDCFASLPADEVRIATGVLDRLAMRLLAPHPGQTPTRRSPVSRP